MIYRIYPLTHETYFKTTPVYSEMPRRKGLSVPHHEYRAEFEMIEISDGSPSCQFYRSPLVAPWHVHTAQLVDGEMNSDPPIFFCGEDLYVSEFLLKELCELDDFEHQFAKVPFLRRNEKLVDAIAYYQLFVRRFVKLTDLSEGEYRAGGFTPTEVEREFLPTIKSNDSICAGLSKLPIWSYLDQPGVYYINEQLFQIVKKLDRSSSRNFFSV